jgi:hypothetical protein
MRQSAKGAFPIIQFLPGNYPDPEKSRPAPEKRGLRVLHSLHARNVARIYTKIVKKM